ncbi:MAG: glycosyltransferase family 2 protein [Tannerella sp.]|jgi:glycosyltransferase involved in cell wall biosynthesis|nr:glycosyltransferase family 2 protein [Tannerella sp.]
METLTNNIDTSKELDLGLTCVIIPTYNNVGTVKAVVDDVWERTGQVVIVNDGSTDGTTEILKPYERGGVEIISYRRNRGKGYALRKGFYCAESFYRGAITLDADGQHSVEEIAEFLPLIKEHPQAVIVGQRIIEGDMPAKNTFANSFSNFWFTVFTWRRLRDTQNGYRYYPLFAMSEMYPFCRGYAAEFELLVRCAWRGFRFITVPVHVYYPPKDKRVSHFRPVVDFLRITALNIILIPLAIVYGYPSLLYYRLYPKKPRLTLQEKALARKNKS